MLKIPGGGVQITLYYLPVAVTILGAIGILVLHVSSYYVHSNYCFETDSGTSESIVPRLSIPNQLPVDCMLIRNMYPLTRWRVLLVVGENMILSLGSSSNL